MSVKKLHIIAFDIPYPPNYGGVIDVFHKIRMLHKAGIQVMLHAFEYGRERQEALEKLCSEVHYYQRNMSPACFFRITPFIVQSRQSENLRKRLLEDGHPILCEGLHSCYLLKDKRFADRFIIYRESNIEHHYYMHLAKAERNPLKFLYFFTETIKLWLFQKHLTKAKLMLPVSQSDTDYLQKHFPENHIEYLPSFHENDMVSSKAGKGRFILYHGKLSVAENLLAAKYIAEQIAPKTDHQIIIAGLEPSEQLRKICRQHGNMKLEANVPKDRMQELMREAHIHLLITFQATGLKLKLLNTLYQGRFCIANKAMLQGTGLEKSCIIADNTNSIIQKINACFQKDFDDTEIRFRQDILKENYDNQAKTNKLLRLLFGSN